MINMQNRIDRKKYCTGHSNVSVVVSTDKCFPQGGHLQHPGELPVPDLEGLLRQEETVKEWRKCSFEKYKMYQNKNNFVIKRREMFNLLGRYVRRIVGGGGRISLYRGICVHSYSTTWE
jgi:hypothetical protein